MCKSDDPFIDVEVGAAEAVAGASVGVIVEPAVVAARSIPWMSLKLSAAEAALRNLLKITVSLSGHWTLVDTNSL